MANKKVRITQLPALDDGDSAVLPVNKNNVDYKFPVGQLLQAKNNLSEADPEAARNNIDVYSRDETDSKLEAVELRTGFEYLSDYVDGPITFTARNQITAYNGEFYRPSPSVTLPFTTSGNDATSWEVDKGSLISVGDASLRQYLASSSGASGVKTEQGYTLQEITNKALIADTSSNSPKVVLHRGCYAGAPENTIPAFNLAARMGVWGVECDVQFTSDNIPVISHDATVDRCTDGTGAISGKTLAQIKVLDAGSYFGTFFAGTRIPTLEEHVSNCARNGLHPYIEFKNDTVYTEEQLQLCLDIIVKYFPNYNFTCISFDTGYIEKLRAYNKKVNLLLVVSSYYDWLEGYCETNSCGIDIDFVANSSLDYSSAKSKGIFLSAWTVNSQTLARQAMAAGFDAITTNTLWSVK